jgi:hypothetical protein
MIVERSLRPPLGVIVGLLILIPKLAGNAISLRMIAPAQRIPALLDKPAKLRGRLAARNPSPVMLRQLVKLRGVPSPRSDDGAKLSNLPI